MKANEFRLGNLINTPKGIQKIIDVLCDGVNTENYETLTYERVEPIPLTEEILLKCDGYVYIGWDDMRFIRFDEYNCDIFELEVTDGGFLYDGNKIEFLHDLQNCYYFHLNRKVELKIEL